MKVLVIGAGGREHALVHALKKSEKIEQLFCAPGNAGIDEEAKCVNIPVDDMEALLQFALNEKMDITVVGPEQPLTNGIVDLFQKNGLKIFGPSRAAARLEASKSFTKDFCARHNIPTAAYETYTNSHAALAALEGKKYPLVIKADGLAAGKGVIIAHSKLEAEDALKNMLEDIVFGEAGKKVVIEEFLKGEEASFIVVSDGKHVLPLATSQDHKAIFDNDEGPNTGGMGAYSPAPVVTSHIYDRIMHEIIYPTIKGMQEEDSPFVGILYAGIMIVDGEPKLLEYNVRFGDPETQPILARLQSDFLSLVEYTLDAKLDQLELKWDERPAVCVVMTSGGYPSMYERGKIITGIKQASELEDVMVYHSGTSKKDGEYLTSGGRVLSVTAIGNPLAVAIEKAYQAVKKIRWEDCYYRKDIGMKAIKREHSH
ncbi:MAG: phosphoribosylamine--glycine ligase [Deltaproteobacteria bacterium CG_4_10_14_0_2_um_filter_43_8]|nr:MAG: phosphoribosylamine--glycine ligase [Deltaproteobacteria bacterium CG11_big_fil_rev_8_21_14_0_20_42_23]PJA22403.1 MAG: phosphoribosylamine--glycine ligase [Deltaproteobacteria bacterium CG_4_10_14_0_2_um_filter_43_8]PJC64224.1 MAG: phosphoribosylamine--glycine ligase [Deltaproteobacteria bacterium CG_4_9_14_0_2_um_filter_42_21]